ncbi:rhodanese-like domain-containing protein [Pelagibacteraceae bacterium]|jgi:thiosulfate/3-mercaptopyruvate sulfurtransferase|nr:rhodanese-like domain-containing protein [Pelagibacteraceae bacterium]
MTLVSTEWLNNNFNKVKIIDASWHLIKNRNAVEEYNKEHIKNAVFFDLDKNSNPKKNLLHSHFLPTISSHEKSISKMGILNTDRIIIYCYSDLISSCRAWFQFLYFGHDPKLVSVLNGGMKKWKLENRKITNSKTKIIPSKYKAKENNNMIKLKSQIEENIKKKEFTVLDARSKNRFLGLEPEPRQGVKSGSIKGSKSLPLNKLINTKDNTFLNKKKLKEIFNLKGINSNKIVMSCGSSVSASSLALAYSIINDDYMAKIYIGSWTEYGKK